MSRMRILLSGKPGGGKSKLVLDIIKELKAKRKIAGIITPEIRKNNERFGFKIIDLASDEERILASLNEKGPKVSKYHVNIKNIDYIVEKFLSSEKDADLIIIDEIGKMELFSKKFSAMVKKIFRIDKPLIAVVHRNLIDNYRDKGEIIWVTRNKIDELKEDILKKINFEKIKID